MSTHCNILQLSTQVVHELLFLYVCMYSEKYDIYNKVQGYMSVHIETWLIYVCLVRDMTHVWHDS